MIDVRVDASVGDEPEQVDPPAPLPCSVDCPAEGRILMERARTDGAVHPHQILVDDAARADREVADLGVPHLSVGQADRLARGGERRVRVARPEIVEDGRLGELDRVARPGWREAPAVEDDEGYEGEAARQIAANDSTSSDAPPTSAPSTSGWASSSAALSGLTEPP